MKKYTYKDSGIEWLGKIPEHWDVGKVKRGCSEIDTGKTPSTSVSEYFFDGSVEWYAPECFNETLWIDEPKKLINQKAVDDGQIKVYPAKSVYFVAVGATAGKVGIISKPASCNQQINILHTNHKLLPEYLTYQFKLLETEIIKFAQYTTLPILNQAKTGILEITFPPLQEQKAIAEYLDKATARIDRIIAIKQEQLVKMEESFFSKLDSILTYSEYGIENSKQHEGFIKRNIPNDWKIDRLRDVAIINETKLSAKTNPDFILNYIDIGNVNKYGIIDKEAIEKMSFEEAPSRARRVTKIEDTIISSVRTNLQAVAFIDFEIEILISSTGFFVCRPKYKEHLRPKFLYYFLLTVYSKDFFFSNSMGVSYPAINDYRFGSIYVFIPPPDIQDDIVDKLDTLRDTVQKSQDNLNSQIKTLQAYRKSLIHECVTGKKIIVNG